VPFSLLLKQSFRQSRTALRLVGGFILFGVFLHVVWLLAPAFDFGAILVTPIAVIGIVSLGIGIVDRVAVRLRGGAYAE
jgi:hypothetical protein